MLKKLNLGCYNKQLPGFINVDVRSDVNPDVCDDVIKLDKFQKESIDLIYSSHVLEHFSYKDTVVALGRWFDILKKGGVLRLAVPDLEAVFAHYFYHKDIQALKHMLYGSQRHDFDFHYNGWTFESLKSDLELAGFSDVQLWNWRTTEPHNYCDDYSQAYVPHMDKENGKLMSLNVEAKKC